MVRSRIFSALRLYTQTIRGNLGKARYLQVLQEYSSSSYIEEVTIVFCVSLHLSRAGMNIAMAAAYHDETLDKKLWMANLLKPQSFALNASVQRLPRFSYFRHCLRHRWFTWSVWHTVKRWLNAHTWHDTTQSISLFTEEWHTNMYFDTRSFREIRGLHLCHSQRSGRWRLIVGLSFLRNTVSPHMSSLAQYNQHLSSCGNHRLSLDLWRLCQIT